MATCASTQGGVLFHGTAMVPWVETLLALFLFAVYMALSCGEIVSVSVSMYVCTYLCYVLIQQHRSSSIGMSCVKSTILCKTQKCAGLFAFLGKAKDEKS